MNVVITKRQELHITDKTIDEVVQYYINDRTLDPHDLSDSDLELLRDLIAQAIDDESNEECDNYSIEKWRDEIDVETANMLVRTFLDRYCNAVTKYVIDAVNERKGNV